MIKQIIIARKDLHMSPGKLSAQVSHGSMAFLTGMIKKNVQKTEAGMFYSIKNGMEIKYSRPILNELASKARTENRDIFYARRVGLPDGSFTYEPCDKEYYHASFDIEKNIYEGWINDAFTKCVLQARNKNHLLKAITAGQALGMEIGKDIFPIYDNCYTELAPEEENGTTLTVVGFKPMESEIIDKIGRKYHLYT